MVLAGPPNSGKSTLFNALLQEAAAITSAQAGTTRDAIERPVALDGIPLVLVDTAGLRETSEDEIEVIGIARAQQQIERADMTLWLGPEGKGPDGAVEVAARIDENVLPVKRSPDHRVSAMTGVGLDKLQAGIVNRARAILPKAGDVALNNRQAMLIDDALVALKHCEQVSDPLLIAENLRLARHAFDQLTGRSSTEDMLDTLFGKFCIGK